MINCNHCGEYIGWGKHYIEVEMTSILAGLPFFYFYCSTQCQLKNMKIAVKVSPIKEDEQNG